MWVSGSFVVVEGRMGIITSFTPVRSRGLITCVSARVKTPCINYLSSQFLQQGAATTTARSTNLESLHPACCLFLHSATRFTRPLPFRRACRVHGGPPPRTDTKTYTTERTSAAVHTMKKPGVGESFVFLFCFFVFLFVCFCLFVCSWRCSSILVVEGRG